MSFWDDDIDVETDADVSRRDFLRSLSGTAVARQLAKTGTGVGGSVAALDTLEYEQEQWVEELEADRWEQLRVNPMNQDIWEKGGDVLGTGKSPEDWIYSMDRAIAGTAYWVKSRITGGRFTAIQRYAAEDAFVGTAEDSIFAAFDKRGRNTSVLVDSFHQVPTRVYKEGPLQGAKPREGGFAGWKEDEAVSWFWEDDYDHDIAYRDGASMLELTAENDDLQVEEDTYIVPGEELLVRDFTVTNTGSEPREGSFVYYTQANANRNQQDFTAFSTDTNRFYIDDSGYRSELVWTSQENGMQLRVGMDADVDVTRAAGKNTGPFTDDVDPETIKQAFMPQSDPAGKMLDAGMDTDVMEKMKELYRDQRTLDDVMDAEEQAVDARYIAGFLEADTMIAPGESMDVSVFVRAGEDAAVPEEYHEIPAEKRQKRVEAEWKNILADLDMTVADAYQDEHTQWTVAALGMIAPDGKPLAGMNQQPCYHYVWPRDGTFEALSLARKGRPDIAKDFFRFMGEVQEDGGWFHQCYDTDGRPFGYVTVENDQQPIVVSGVHETYEITGDDAFLAEMWDDLVQDALEYTAGQVLDGDEPYHNGLLKATPDFQELPRDMKNQTLWTNTWAYEGLKTGAEMARELGEYRDATRYADAADRLGAVMVTEFVADADDGYWTHITRDQGLDGTFYDNKWKRPTADVATLTQLDWADDYNVKDVFIDDWSFMDDTYSWMPTNYDHVNSMYEEGHDQAAHALLDRMVQEQNVAGLPPERIIRRDGAKEYEEAMPLGWALANATTALRNHYQAFK